MGCSAVLVSTVITLVAAVIFVSAAKIYPLAHFGFTCGDPKLSFPYNPRETVSSRNLLLVTLGVPILVILISEWLWWRGRNGPRWNWLKQALHWISEYIAGLILVITFTFTIKALVGEPRPHFFDSCRPKELANCTKGTYVKTFECTQEPPSFALHNCLKSFPSGHAAAAFYFFIFLSWFIQKRCGGFHTWFSLWLQSSFLVFATFCSMSRIFDHYHHWWDVATGAAFGIVFGVIAVKTVSSFLKTDSDCINRRSLEGKTSGPLTFIANDNQNVRWFLTKASGFPDENNDGAHIITMHQ